MTEKDGFSIPVEDVLDHLPDGVALVDEELSIQWSNRCLREWLPPGHCGSNFYAAFGDPVLLGAEPCPFRSAYERNLASSGTLQTSDNRFFQVHASPILSKSGSPNLVVTVSDITSEILQQQKLAAIHQAGYKLTDLKPEEIFAMDVEQRIDLLKDNIRHYTQDLLNVEVIEIRLLEQSTGNLIPLLSVGIDQQAADRRLMARPQGNGVTGFVASNGKSYLCEDASTDPLFIEGFKGAKVH